MLAAFAPQPPEFTPDRTKHPEAITVKILAHLIDSRCWTDHSDMPDARRLRATFRIWIGRDGRFSREPELIAPATEPQADSSASLFVGYAREALARCNAIGWPVTEDLLRLPDPPPWIDITFLPSVSPP
jgi:hypothetical protein